VRRTLISAALVALSVVALQAEAHDMIPNIEYAVADGISLRLDLYLPQDATGPVPLVLWVHGGAWRAGDKHPTYAPETLGESYAVASVNYRLTDVAQFPAQIHDVKAAVRFLRGNADRYGLDPDRFGAWGSSAGGHLVALLGTSCGNADVEGTLGDHLDESSCVQAVCDFYGPTDFLVLLDERGGRDARRSMPEDALLGGPVEENIVLATLASPIAHVDPSDPPFLIMHGSDDATVPVEQSIAFDAVLQEADVESTLIVIDGAGHGFPRTEIGPVKTFFDRHLATAASAEGSSVFHRDGQTFLTWPEGASTHFAIYRSTSSLSDASDLLLGDRIAVLSTGSARNGRGSAVEKREMRYAIHDGADPLSERTGLFVHTAAESGLAFYAVASCDAFGNVDQLIRSIGPIDERVACPEPVLQEESEIDGAIRAHYVHWAPYVDTEAADALCHRPSEGFNFIVWEPALPQEDGAALFALHGGGGSYANARPYKNHPNLTVLGLDSHIPGFELGLNGTGDAWYGWNEHVGTDIPLAGGLNVDYTTRRLRWTAEWLTGHDTTIDPARLFLRGSSMGGVGTAFSSIMLRDIFAAGLSVVPRFNYSADDIPRGSDESFAARWGPMEKNVSTTDGIGILERLDACFLAEAHPDWSFAPVWAFNGRNDEAVGWSEKIPFYETMNETRHGWAFFWDERAHGGRSPFPRAWREDGTEDEILAWMIETVRLDRSYPAFSGCSLDDDPGNGDPLDGDLIGTINGYLRWDTSRLEDSDKRWAIDLFLDEAAPASTCTVDVTPRRRQAFAPNPGTPLHYAVRASGTGAIIASGVAQVEEDGRVTISAVPVTVEGVRLIVETE